MTPDALTCQALLNCLIREVSGPEHQVREADGELVIRLARTDVWLRAELRRPSAGLGPRVTGRVRAADRVLGHARLAGLIAAELSLASGVVNDEFVRQVQASHAATAALLAGSALPTGLAGSALPTGQHARAGRRAGADRIARFLASEQSLVAGHRFHPTPKARDGAPRDWLRYAPEAGARFPLRFLGVPQDIVAERGDTGLLDALGGPSGAGHRVLPVHPWQHRLLAHTPWFRRALRRGLITDLGAGARDVVPTSSVRTVYDPVADVFGKFSLNVRLTNCVRKSAWYELDGSVLLTEVLGPVFADLAVRYPGTVLLGEPGYRTVALASRDGYEGLAVIVRHGVAGSVPPDLTPLLAASLTEPGEPTFASRDDDWLLGWWSAYVRLVAPPVLAAFFRHGVVLEPHLQNVLVAVDRDDWPAAVVFRDLEGVKLTGPRHEPLLAGLPSDVAGGLRYDEARGWDRVAYCLLVNHLAEIAAAIADGHRDARLELALWAAARRSLTTTAAELDWPPRLRALLAGVPLPAKANLRVRWARAADRDADYVAVPNPLRSPDRAPWPVPA